MKNQDAQFILNGYRPGGQDASDPLFAEALEQAKRDPALAKWLAREQAHAASVAGKLREVAPPAQLRTAVLAGAQLVQPAPARHWTRPAFIGIAAALALVAGVVAVQPAKPAMDVEQLAGFAIKDAQAGKHARPIGTAAKDLQALLEQDSTCLATGMHFDFETLRTTGCRTLSDDGHELVEICFRRNGDYYHLYIVRHSDFPNVRLKTFTGPAEREGVSFVSWASQNYFFMLTSRGTPAAMQQLL